MKTLFHAEGPSPCPSPHPMGRGWPLGRERGPRASRVIREIQKPKFQSAFTLMEMMLVIGILAIVMAMSIPPIYRGMSKEPMRQAVSGVMDACTAARAQAILQGKTTAVVFHPQERTYAAEGGTPGARPGASLSGQFQDSILIEMLDVNLMDRREAEVAKVRFFPNGTSDEFTLILQSDKGEYRRLELESTTGILSFKELR